MIFKTKCENCGTEYLIEVAGKLGLVCEGCGGKLVVIEKIEPQREIVYPPYVPPIPDRETNIFPTSPYVHGTGWETYADTVTYQSCYMNNVSGTEWRQGMQWSYNY